MDEEHIRKEFHLAGGVLVTKWFIPRGARLTQHRHKYDHVSTVVWGQVTVSCDGKLKRYSAGDCITIPAGVQHTVEAQTTVLWLCIHATQETDLGRIESTLIEDMNEPTHSPDQPRH